VGNLVSVELLSAANDLHPPEPKPKNTEEAARQFEGLLIAQMLRSARESGSAGLGDSDEDESQRSTMMDLAEQQFARIMAQNGGLGLARLIMQGLRPPKEWSLLSPGGSGSSSTGQNRER
jgi:Rod binding domain-containing protein